MGSKLKTFSILVCVFLFLSESAYGSTSPATRTLLHADAASTAGATVSGTDTAAAGADPAAAGPAGAAGAAPAGGIFDLVATCGAKENEDVTELLMKAFTDACASTTPATVVVPTGVFMVGPIRMKGPCKNPLTFQLDGTLKADPDAAKFPEQKWISFDTIDFFTLTGAGIIDGNGAAAWAASDCKKKASCPGQPYNIRFDKLNHSYITGVTSKDSKNFHSNILQCKNTTLEKFKVTTPDDSPNTDGIHIGRSCDIKIIDCVLHSGDDCISVGDQTSNLEVSKVMCGPGHGLSIGSLGKYENEGPVTAIKIKDSTLTNTDNGARIKAWSGMFPCVVDDILFEGLTMENVSNPIILDQCYCPHGLCKKGEPTLVKMTNVVFRNIKGTSSDPEAVQIMCSPNMCENIELCDIDLAYSGPKMENYSSVCLNVKPKITPPLNPPGPTCCA